LITSFLFNFEYFFLFRSVALQTGQLGPVLAQFGLPEEAITAANEGDLQAFAQAMEKHYKKGNEGGDEKKPSDNTMDTS
jgi:26S proteasome regulatory subunit N13